MKPRLRLYVYWIERRIEASVRQGGHFDRAWSFKWVCIFEIISMLPLYLAAMVLLALYKAMSEPDRDLISVMTSIIRFHAAELRWDSFLLYFLAIAVALQCILLYREIERAKPRVFRRLNCCIHCGYPLSDADQPVCTECGKVVKRPEPARHRETTNRPTILSSTSGASTDETDR